MRKKERGDCGVGGKREYVWEGGMLRITACMLQEDSLSIFVSVSLNLHKNQMVFYYS